MTRSRPPEPDSEPDLFGHAGGDRPAGGRWPPDDQPPGTLAEARQMAVTCTRCDLYRNATQTVFGEGPPGAAIMLVGEQPGDLEDLQGRPFVGPAGKLLDRALAEAGLDRPALYVTNAVKHFKHEPRGRKRLHKRPALGEIDVCAWWLAIERRTVAPKVIVALGATAIRALTGRSAAIASLRGRENRLPDRTILVATIHPSYLLRLPDRDAAATEYRRLVADLVAARQAAA
jgi:uracil-DNA glycosylase family protein